MEKKVIDSILSLYLKDDLKELAYNMGLSGISKLTKDELKLEIIRENGIQSIDKILNKMNKSYLITTCEFFNLPYDKKRKDELIFQVQEYLKPPLKQSNQKVEKVQIQRELVFSTTKENKTLAPQDRYAIENQPESFDKAIIKNDKTLKSKSTITIEKVLEYIKSCRIKAFNYEKDEDHLTNCLIDHFKGYIAPNDIRKEYKIGSEYNLRIDIDLFDEKFGIEVKKWSSIGNNNAVAFERAIGQAYLYKKNDIKITI